MKYNINDKEIDIVFDGQYYIGTYGCVQIRRQYKQDVIHWFVKRFSR